MGAYGQLEPTAYQLSGACSCLFCNVLLGSVCVCALYWVFGFLTVGFEVDSSSTFFLWADGDDGEVLFVSNSGNVSFLCVTVISLYTPNEALPLQVR